MVLFIEKGSVNSIITQFGFAHPFCRLGVLVTYGYSFYSSSLCDVYENDSKNYILLGTLKYTDYMIWLGQSIPGF